MITRVLLASLYTAVSLTASTVSLSPAGEWAWLSQAYAGRNLAPGDINLQTVAGRADFARFLYFTVNGPATGYTISGPVDGFTGMINTIMLGMGKRLETEGYRGCASIPSTGSISKSIQTKDGEMTVTMAFSAGSKAVPSYFAHHGGETFGKRIEVSKSDTKFMAIELLCDADATIKTGYILTSGNQFNKRNFEIYFQSNTTTKAGFVDLMHTSSDADGEKLAARFQTADGDQYNLWLIRTTTGGSQGITGAYFGLKGSASGKLAQIHAIHTTGAASDTTMISNATHKNCISFASEAAVEGVNCATVADPTGNSQFNSADLTWNIAGVAGASVSSLP